MTDFSKDSLQIGRLAGAFNLRGEIKVVSTCTPEEEIFAYPVWWDQRGTQTFKVKKWRRVPNGFAVLFEGFTDRTMAEKIPKMGVYIPKDQRQAVEDDDTFYEADLIGVSVFLQADGVLLGEVISLHNF